MIERIRRDRPEPAFPISLRTGWDPQGMEPERIRDELAALRGGRRATRRQRALAQQPRRLVALDGPARRKSRADRRASEVGLGGGFVARADVLVEPAVHRLRCPARRRRCDRARPSSTATWPVRTGGPRAIPCGGGARCAGGPSGNHAARSSASRIRGECRTSCGGARRVPSRARGRNARRRLRRGSARAGPASGGSSPRRRTALRRSTCT